MDAIVLLKKRKLVDQMIVALTQEAHIEETIFYPTARERAADRSPRAGSVEERDVVPWMLSELANTDADQPATFV
jgi:hypothetical protein